MQKETQEDRDGADSASRESLLMKAQVQKRAREDQDRADGTLKEGRATSALREGRIIGL